MNWETICFIILTAIDTLELVYLITLSMRLTNESIERKMEIAKLNSVIAATQSASERKCGKAKKGVKKVAKKPVCRPRKSNNKANVKGVY